MYSVSPASSRVVGRLDLRDSRIKLGGRVDHPSQDEGYPSWLASAYLEFYTFLTVHALTSVSVFCSLLPTAFIRTIPLKGASFWIGRDPTGSDQYLWEIVSWRCKFLPERKSLQPGWILPEPQ